VADPDWQRVKDVFQGAFARAPEGRAAFLDAACAADAELRGEVESLLASHQEAGSFLSRPADVEESFADLTAPAAPRRLGPYRVLDVIAHGGMGTVYRAVRDDDTFQKTVALKLVRAGVSSGYVEQRFLQERRILARLQHPNIAAILDGGTTEEGHPYLVMEHVLGQPLTVYCDDQGLGTRARLAMFRSVCAAVHYAHQSLVVHRDLKPDNILVTTDGTPKLLDFGIAKLLAAGVDPDTAPTATLLPMMTPEYASPEQVKGEPVTTASDVYSLGVLLYELLAGRRPYAVKADSLEEIVRAVCQTDPPSPSAVAKTTAAELRGDLDTIVLRALHKDPARRYASVQELSEDVRRHLEGRPVRARADTLGYRAGKFVRRNRVAVAAAALAVVVLAAGVVAIVRQQRIAEAHRARAEARFADVRRLANGFLFEFEQAIQDLPGSTPARQLVVQKGLEYLDGLAREASGDPVLQAELATAYQKVGDVQGNPFGANLGDTAGALASYRKEVAIRQVLVAASPRDRPAARGLMAAYRRLGRLEDEGGETGKGVEHLARALALGESLLSDDPGDSPTRRLLALAHDGAGQLALKTGNSARAEEHQRRALAIWEAETHASPTDQEALRGVHLTHGSLGRTLLVTGRLPESIQHYTRALEAARQRLALAPGELVARRDESNAHGNLAMALHRQGQLEESAAHIARSLAFDEEMLRADPKNSQVQRDVSWDLGFMGELAAARGDLEEALAHQRRALAIDQARAEASPSAFQARKDVAESWAAVSDLLVRLGRLPPALEASLSSVRAFEALRAANPSQLRVQQLLAVQYGRQGLLAERMARSRVACQSIEQSLALWKELQSKNAVDAENRTQRAEMEQASARCGASSRR
jgi:eukaryotic-like serine/threonine-protein kinase